MRKRQGAKWGGVLLAIAGGYYFVARGGSERSTVRWSPATGIPRIEQIGEVAAQGQVSFIKWKDRSSFMTRSGGLLELRDEDGRLLRSRMLPDPGTSHVILSDRQALLVGRETTLYAGEADAQIKSSSDPMSMEPSPYGPKQGSSFFVVSPDASLVAGEYSAGLAIYDAKDWRVRSVIHISSTSGWRLWSISGDDSKVVVSVGKDVQVIDVRSGSLLASFDAQVTDAQLSPDGRLLAVSFGRDDGFGFGSFGGVKIFRISDKTELASYSAPSVRCTEDYPNCDLGGELAWDPKQRFLSFINGGLTSISLWNPNQRTQQLAKIEINFWAGALGFSPDGKRLAVGDVNFGPLNSSDNNWILLFRIGDQQ
jgi:hypothetical protein